MSMKGDNSKVASLLAMGMAMYGGAMAFDPATRKTYREKSEELKPLPMPKPPTGTKEYYFNATGGFSTEQMLKSECVFKCAAINDKNAQRKFAKWQKSNQQPQP